MKSSDLIQSFAEFKDQKNIDRETMKEILEDVFRAILVKNYGSDENYDVIINVDKGDFEIYRILEVVADEDFTDENRQIPLSKARLAADDYEVGEEYTEEIKVEQFARRNILAIRQNLASRVTEMERNNLFERYRKRVGLLVTAEVYQIRKREIVLRDDEENELFLPKSEQIPSDHFRKGDSVRAGVGPVRGGGIPENTASIVRSSSTVTVAGLSVMVVVPTLKCLKLYPANAVADRVIFSPCSTLSLVCSSTEVVAFFTVRVPSAAGGVLMVIVCLMGSNSAPIATFSSTV